MRGVYKKAAVIWKNYRYGIITGSVVLAALITGFKPEKQLVETGTVIKGRFTRLLREQGVTRAVKKTTIYALASGILREVKVQSGDAVRKGYPVALLQWDQYLLIRAPH